VLGRIVPSASEPRLSQGFDPLERELNFTAKYFYTISTDTHIDHMVILPIRLPRGANKNATATVHFEASNRARGPMRYHNPCRSLHGSGRRAGRQWIFYSLLIW
jgi:hypothetical protein